MMDKYAQEIIALSAETHALQSILVHVLGRLAVKDAAIAEAIRLGFDDAASSTENTAIKFGKTASSDHLVKAIAIIEELRAATLGNPDKPRDAV
jgi:hypothetical protein